MAVVGVVGRLPRENPHRTHAVSQARQDFNCRKRRLLSIFASELEMKHTIRRGSDLREYFDIGGQAGAGVCHHVESVEQSFAIRTNRHDPAAFSAGSSRLRTEYCFGEVQAQFVCSFRQGNIVAELPLAIRSIKRGILGARNARNGAL